MSVIDFNFEILTGLKEYIDETRRQTRKHEKREVSEAARSLITMDYADLPVPSAEKVGWKVWVNDGRTPGEGAGNGSGVECVCKETSKGSGVYAWQRTCDYTTVAV